MATFAPTALASPCRCIPPRGHGRNKASNGAGSAGNRSDGHMTAAWRGGLEVGFTGDLAVDVAKSAGRAAGAAAERSGPPSWRCAPLNRPRSRRLVHLGAGSSIAATELRSPIGRVPKRNCKLSASQARTLAISDRSSDLKIDSQFSSYTFFTDCQITFCLATPHCHFETRTEEIANSSDGHAIPICSL